MKFIHTVVSYEWLETMFKLGNRPKHEVTRGLPKDAILYSTEMDPNNRLLHLYFISKDVGHTLSEGALLKTIPIEEVVFETNR